MLVPEFFLRGLLITGNHSQEHQGLTFSLAFSCCSEFRSLFFSDLLCGPLFTLTPPEASPTGFLKSCFSGLGYRKTNEEKADGWVQNPKASLFCCLPACQGHGGLGSATSGCPRKRLRCLMGPESLQEFHSALGLCCSWN